LYKNKINHICSLEITTIDHDLSAGERKAGMVPLNQIIIERKKVMDLSAMFLLLLHHIFILFAHGL
jgi:hypothetical protein